MHCVLWGGKASDIVVCQPNVQSPETCWVNHYWALES